VWRIIRTARGSPISNHLGSFQGLIFENYSEGLSIGLDCDGDTTILHDPVCSDRPRLPLVPVSSKALTSEHSCRSTHREGEEPDMCQTPFAVSDVGQLHTKMQGDLLRMSMYILHHSNFVFPDLYPVYFCWMQEPALEAGLYFFKKHFGRMLLLYLSPPFYDLNMYVSIALVNSFRCRCEALQ
jgi:hypothetical protein